MQKVAVFFETILKIFLNTRIYLRGVKFSQPLSPCLPVLDPVLKNVHGRYFVAKSPRITQHVIYQLSFICDAPAGAFAKRCAGREGNKIERTLIEVFEINWEQRQTVCKFLISIFFVLNALIENI